jgi:site-specific DNA-methyltransferase (adenine-specific)
MSNSTTLINGDCLEAMKDIPDGSVDLILTDPPYGTTACKWDSIIPLEPMWEQLNRIIKPNGAIVMTASQPFTTTLIASNMKMFKYCWVWEKTRPTGHVHAKNKPLKSHEDIVVFSKGVTIHKGQSKNRMNYNPQGLIDCDVTIKQSTASDVVMGMRSGRNSTFKQTKTGYPKSVLKFPSISKNVHPTQKPVPLMEYLIKTYTNEGETVLDFTMGSGTTGVACKNLDREFIGIELDKEYYDIAVSRIETII